MKAGSILVALLLLCVAVSQAEVKKHVDREISQFTVGTDPEIFASIARMPGGGALLSGFTSSTEENRQMDAYLAEIDDQGVLAWESTYGDTLSEEFWDAVPVDGGGYIAVGTSNSYGDKEFDLWIVRLDADHEEVWSTTISQPTFGVASCVVEDGEGGWYIGGFQSSEEFDRADFRVLRMDDDGTILWDNIYGGPEHDFLLAMTASAEGGVICAGSTHSFTSENRDGYVVKIDEDGTQVWQRVIGGPWPDYFNDIYRTQTNKYVLVGTTHTEETSEQSDMYVVLLDEDSNVLFQTTIGGDSWDEGWGVVQMSDRGFFCVGSSFDPDAGVMNGYGVRLDQNGEILWTNTYGDEDGYQEFRDVIIWDGDLVKAVGYTSSTDFGDADFYTQNMVASENGVSPISPTVSQYMRLSRAYPNPFNSSTVFSVYLPMSTNLEVNVYNLLGQKVRNLTVGPYAAGSHRFEWRATDYASGTYVIEARTDSQTLRQRILLVK